MNVNERIFQFNEPHPTGGHSTITITGDKIVAYMRSNFPEYPQYFDMTDEELIEEFKINNWAWEVANGKYQK